METSVNNKCRAFTSLEQSQKLAEILPIESADMYYEEVCNLPEVIVGNYILHNQCMEDKDYKKLSNPVLSPAWSLSALLDVLPDTIDGIESYGRLTIDKEGDAYNISYDDILSEESIILFSEYSLIDACVAMIEKLNELKLL